MWRTSKNEDITKASSRNIFFLDPKSIHFTIITASYLTKNWYVIVLQITMKLFCKHESLIPKYQTGKSDV